MDLVPSGPSNGIGQTLSGATIVSSTLSGALIFASSITGSTITASTFSGGTIANSTLSGVTIVASTISGMAARATTAQVAADTNAELYVSPDRAIYGQGYAKSWAVWTVTGGTVTLRDSYGVTSISDNGVGDYSVNFTVEFPTGYYGSALTIQQLTVDNSEGACSHPSITPTTGVYRLVTYSGNGVTSDVPRVYAAFWGDRA